MKIAISAYDHPDYASGPNVWIRRLLPQLRQRGVASRPLFITSGNQWPTLDALGKQSFDCVRTSWLPYTEQRVRWILERIAEDPPDLFIADTLTAASYAARWVREAGIPVVTIVHSDDAYYRAMLEQFSLGPSKYHPSATICVSQFLESYAREHTAEDVTTCYIPYGVPVPADTTHRTNEALRLVYCGRLVEKQKRISHVATTLVQVTRQLSHTEAVIIGDGPDREQVERIVSESDSNRVRLTGLIDNDRIQMEFLKAHIIVLLSDYEGLPIVLLEAMACGVVPVCLRIRSGIPELIEDGVTGLVVDDREQSFIDAVARLHSDSELWERLSDGARRKIETEYSLPCIADRWSEFLRQCTLRTHSQREVQIPRRLQLPPVHPDLARDDTRQPGLAGRWARKVLYRLGLRKPFS